MRDETERPSADSRPLSDIRVLDLTVAWAGPFATRSLAWLGADVIKIEGPERPDPWRGLLTGGPPHHYPDLEHGERPYNRDLLFNTQNHDKRALSLDLKAPGGVGVFHRLAEISDVVLANFTPGVLDRLGIGYEALAAVNPDIIVIEMPAFGSTGPMAGHQGMGKTMEAACGMASLLGYPEDEVPVLTGPAILDPIGGLHGAAAVLTALELRAQEGRGCHVEVPQTEAAAHWIGELVLEEAHNGRSSFRADGNRIPEAAPHDAFPAAGTDQWIAISVPDETSWSALCAAIDRPDLATDPRFSSAVLRQQHQDEIEIEIAAWTRQRSKRDAARELQAAGVPAGPVNDGIDVACDPGLNASGFLETVEHPEAGTHRYPGMAFGLDRTPGSIRKPAPLYAQHNHEILADLLGLSDAQIANLARNGVISDSPAPRRPPVGPRQLDPEAAPEKEVSK